jgi:fucose permease
MSQTQTAAVAAPRRRTALLIALAYAAFISLGLPDGLIGVGWPSIRATYGLPIDALGALLITFTIGYLVSSATSGWLLARLGVGMLLVASCVATATALLFYGLTLGWWVMIAFGVFSGVGAGAIDAGLNTYAANNFDARTMNWLHACFGIGAVSGPAIMTAVLASGQRWPLGFFVVAAVQYVLAACFLLTRRMWDTGPATTAASGAEAEVPAASLLSTLRLPVVWIGIALFFIYTGIELAAGQWAFSLLSESRGLSTSVAGLWVSGYWASLTIGRLLFGVVARHVELGRALLACMVGVVIGAALLWWNPATWISLAGLALMGLCFAPIFPSLISTTPGRLPPQHVANTVGFQVSAAAVGGGVVSSLIGVAADSFGLEAIAPGLLLGALALLGLFVLLQRRGRSAQA